MSSIGAVILQDNIVQNEVVNNILTVRGRLVAKIAEFNVVTSSELFVSGDAFITGDVEIGGAIIGDNIIGSPDQPIDDIFVDMINGQIADLVDGPATTTDNSIARWSGTTGNLLKDGPNSTIDDAGNMIVNSINTNAFQMPTGAVINYVLTTDGAGNASWSPGIGVVRTGPVPSANQIALWASSMTNPGEITASIVELANPGAGNILIGTNASIVAPGSNNVAIANTLPLFSGNNNVLLGQGVGAGLGAGNDNVLVGRNVTVSGGNDSNLIVIGANANQSALTTPAVGDILLDGGGVTQQLYIPNLQAGSGFAGILRYDSAVPADGGIQYDAAGTFLLGNGIVDSLAVYTGTDTLSTTGYPVIAPNPSSIKAVTATDNIYLGLISPPVAPVPANATSGSRNTAVGTNALNPTARGAVTDCAAFGHNALSSVTSGIQNTAMGSGALASLTTQSNMTGVGYNALNAGLGSQLTAVGSQAMETTDLTTANCVAVGNQALQTASGIVDATAVGTASSAGDESVSVGFHAGGSAPRSVSLGWGALEFSAASATGSIGIGRGVMPNVTGIGNLVIGEGSGPLITGANRQVVLGNQSALAMTGGDNCVVIGYGTAPTLTTGTHDTIIGRGADVGGATVSYATVVGTTASSGSGTTTLGGTVPMGTHDTSVGFNCMTGATGNSAGNLCVGTNTGAGMDSPENVVLGSGSGIGGLGGAGQNTIVGALAATTLTGSGNVILGHGAEPLAPADTNSIVIGSGATGNGPNSITLDTGGAQTFFVPNLPAVGGMALMYSAGGQIGTAVSSRRYKKNIEDLAEYKDPVNRLRPVRFKYKANDVEDIGLIAEEVQDVVPEIVPKNKEGQPESVRYDLLSVILLQEFQKTHARLEELEKLVQDQNISSS
jgi:hypothetical protein